MSRPRFIALLLALLTLAVYLPVARHGFILYDDGDYVTDNPMVRNGLTFEGIKWAFTTFHSANWHPLTWLSHMADCDLFDLNPAGPHCINALLHAANTVLLFALWLQLVRAREKNNTPADNDDAIWPAAFIAALFAFHPLHVESVAWIAERKDVLSTFFGLLALLCYAHYANLKDRPKTIDNRQSAIGNPQYFLSLLFFTLGLMSKPMLVTLPFVMLLLDYWPLRRVASQQNSSLITHHSSLLLEKLPFFALTAASCVITYIAQNRGAVRSLAAVPLAYRLENVPVAIAGYLFKIVWPSNLAVIYPMPQAIAPAAFIGCSLLLIAITAGVWLARRPYPFLLVGWFWFLGMLVPVIGLVKVGDAARADRYMYIPSVGIFMAVAFAAQKLSKRLSLPKSISAATAIAILIGLTIVTERQLQFWRDDEALFGHAVHVTANNVDAILNYGVALENEGKPLNAIAQYRQAEKLAPSSWLACADLANLLYYTGQTNAALEEYQQAVKLKPDSSTLHDRLGTVLASLGNLTGATNEFFRAINLNAADPAPYLHLGTALARQYDLQGATNEFVTAMRLAPGDPSPLMEWAKALLRAGRDAEAVNKLHEAIQMDPDNFQTLTSAARVLASDKRSGIRNGAEALDLAKKADALTDGSQPLVKDTLGMACAENGQFDAAQEAVNDAIRLARDAGMKHEIIAAMQERLELYQKHQPWRESSDY
jgi:protein O-mannosyl-transferase